MVAKVRSTRFVRFGVFEADLQERDLYRNGLKVKLQEQPFEVLAALLEHPGETVTSEELSRRIWPEGTYVDFEHSLYTAILKIRRVLDDSAENPRFVETIPRHGYRFIAPVQAVSGHQPATRHRPPLLWRLRWAIPLAAVTILVVAVIWFLAPGQPEPQASLRIVPVTSYPGWEWMNSFSPDGNQIAFTRCEPGTWVGDGNCDLYVKQLGSEEALRLTTYPGIDGGGAWSPDGRWIAFLRSPPTGTATYYLVPSLGGTERKLVDAYSPLGSMIWGNTVSWFPDGKKLVVTRADSRDDPLSLFLVAMGSDEPRKLTSPPPRSLGDSNPAISPNGRGIVFNRRSRSDAGGLFLLELTDDFEPRGKPVRLTSGPKRYRSPVWTPDGEGIIFASEGSLWRMTVSNGRASRAERLPLMGERASNPAISPDGQRLAYSQVHGQDDIMRIELSGPGKAAGIPARLASSTRSEMWPEYSTDEGQIAFVSDRSGTFEVWTCDSAGSSLLRVASYTGTFGAKLTWSPEGERIAFPSKREGTWGIVVVQAQGGTPRRLKTGLTLVGGPGELMFGWSRDGEWIYFSSDPGNESEIWKIPAAGGEPVRIAEGAGGAFFESSPENALYYLKPKPEEPRHQSLWKLHLKDWKQSRVLDSVFRASYAIADTGVYYIPGRDLDCRCYHLQFLEFATGQIDTVVDIADIGEGISISPDGRSLLYTERSQTNSDIMLVENFH